MPIEIKELHIKVTVNTPQSGGQTPASRPGAAGSGDNSGDKDAIVAACVEQVMQIIQEKTER